MPTTEYPDYGPYHDYPNKPIGGGNPYWCCIACGASDPQINGTLSGHFAGCKWALEKRVTLAKQPQVDDPIKELTGVLRECGVVPVLWLCPQGCNGKVVWSKDKTDAECQVCGWRKSDIKS